MQPGVTDFSLIYTMRVSLYNGDVMLILGLNLFKPLLDLIIEFNLQQTMQSLGQIFFSLFHSWEVRVDFLAITLWPKIFYFQSGLGFCLFDLCLDPVREFYSL